MTPHSNIRDGVRLDPQTFADHGVADARVLYRAVEGQLAVPAGTTVTVDTMPLGVIAAAFRDAFRSVAGHTEATGGIPHDVAVALSDAVAVTDERFRGHSVDVRGDLLPTFFAAFLGFHDAYHGGAHPVVA
ncbi:hypothetical protein [Halobaculum limi]|uniref:hypothetical protein n=1 Tax=Halobaculum limi TaxID=3031916 RepID=UPI00240768FB|nr:hypothetical protein [Halobaculum sp. YSMS11]